MVMIRFTQPYFREQQQVLGTVNGNNEEDFAGQNGIQVFDRADLLTSLKAYAGVC